MSIRERPDIGPNVRDVEVWGHVLEDGTRPRYTKRVRGGLREAQDVERQLYRRRDEFVAAGATPTVKQVINSYLALRKPEVAPKTYEQWRYLADSHLIPRLGKAKVTKVTPVMVKKLLSKLRESGLSGTTTAKDHKLLKTVFEYAVQEGYVQRNPVAYVKAPRLDTAERKALTPKQAEALLKKLKGTPLHMPALLALATGIRRGEMLALTWADLDLDTGIVHIPKGKTARARRDIPITPHVIAALKEQRSKVARKRLKLANLWHDQDLVFPSMRPYNDLPAGRPWTGFPHEWAKAKTGVDYHELRHTFVTWALQGQVRDEVVSRAAGHSSSVVTRAVYSHVADDEFDAIRAVIKGILG